MEQRRKAPWPDYAGLPIHEGDTVEHPSGERGIVRFFEAGESPSDQWRVDYGDLPPPLRLCLQIGDKGQAVVVPPNTALSCGEAVSSTSGGIDEYAPPGGNFMRCSDHEKPDRRDALIDAAREARNG